ncbi:MAG: hypothetical protein A2126_01270 [Candidatus Woykebacteria bacterium GWB1_45_5]|uniref:Uncharacterized protein n=2 Tax=Candidatus Woykeibacteriota TaxID=1817899 RepID=A0A1G1W5M2_9BACT|nr:MAG: hypothetical protein A2113_02235 [Candidatus Woykebacteria bacterium GWA1_44_8]OGY22806.1 MAG: hypothetical protein A2126_01270 [Candidatus Woykebacteria bacterium GWB1_45_5]
MNTPSAQPEKNLTNKPVFRWISRCSLLLITYVSIYFVLDLIIIPAIDKLVAPESRLGWGILVFTLLLPFNPVFVIDHRLIQAGFNKFESVVLILFLAVVIGTFLGILFATIKNRTILALTFVFITISAFLFYQVAVEGVFCLLKPLSL